MPLLSLKGRLGRLLINIMSQFYQVPCSFVQFPVMARNILIINRGSCRGRNDLRAAHREHSYYCQDFDISVKYGDLENKKYIGMF